MKFNIASLMKNAKNMQSMIEGAQEELNKIDVSGEAGAGMVKITMTCRHNVKSVEIDDSLLKEDKTVLQDLIAGAINDVCGKVENVAREKMMDAGSMLGGDEE